MLASVCLDRDNIIRSRGLWSSVSKIARFNKVGINALRRVESEVNLTAIRSAILAPTVSSQGHKSPPLGRGGWRFVATLSQFGKGLSQLEVAVEAASQSWLRCPLQPSARGIFTPSLPRSTTVWHMGRNE